AYNRQNPIPHSLMGAVMSARRSSRSRRLAPFGSAGLALVAALAAFPARTHPAPSTEPPAPTRQEAEYNGPPTAADVPATSGRRFVDVTKEAGLSDTLWSTSVAWGDLDGDGYPEIYVAHYGDWGFETTPPTDCTYDGKQRDVCQPRRFKPLPHILYKNNGNGT